MGVNLWNQPVTVVPANREEEIIDFTNKGTTRKDASVTNAIAELEKKVNYASVSTGEFGKISSNDVIGLIHSAKDNGKLTRQEWDQIKQWVDQNKSRLTPAAQDLFGKIDRAMTANIAGPHGSPADVTLNNDPFGGRNRESPAILEGANLDRFLAEVDSLSLAAGVKKFGHLLSPELAAAPGPLKDGWADTANKSSWINADDGIDNSARSVG